MQSSLTRHDWFNASILNIFFHIHGGGSISKKFCVEGSSHFLEVKFKIFENQSFKEMVA